MTWELAYNGTTVLIAACVLAAVVLGVVAIVWLMVDHVREREPYEPRLSAHHPTVRTMPRRPYDWDRDGMR